MNYRTFEADQASQMLAARRAAAERCNPRSRAGMGGDLAVRPFIQDGNDLHQIRFKGDALQVLTVGFAPNSDRQITQHEIDASSALEDASENWNPMFSKWRHGGWYAHAVRYPQGSIGCVSNNYPDKAWRVVCDDRRTGALGEAGDFTYPTRIAAARAEYALAQESTRAFVARIQALYEVEYPTIGEPRVSKADILELVSSAGEATACDWLISEGHAACPASARSMIAWAQNS